ncbi:oligopeptide/dipeptide ABC transporter ATP-binding protein, partial [Streptomyces sp. SID9727]|uniref:oligopeptide/dipeptide ABC transporter ATP-binding protein n=1 Tax=Streptomyces sp. SID9727 TaxID=2706114 RepID=UPI0013CC5A42|nr:peptide ABC transporter substrate-binding protein [Streptomyces sp. SID9727]
PHAPPPGCAFEARCPRRRDRCAEQAPPLDDLGSGHRVACWYPLPVPAAPEAVTAS